MLVPERDKFNSAPVKPDDKYVIRVVSLKGTNYCPGRFVPFRDATTCCAGTSGFTGALLTVSLSGTKF
jgi:hypothetical protein